MFRDVPECSEMFRDVPCSGFYRRPTNTGSRGYMFVVRTSKPVENLWKMGYFDRVTVSFYTFYRPQTKRLRARKIGLQYKILSLFLLGTSCLGRPSGDGLRSPLGRRSVRQRGYGLRLLIFKMANNKVDLGQTRSEEIVYSRFMKIPLG